LGAWPRTAFLGIESGLARSWIACMTIRPATTALVVAIAGMMFPAISFCQLDSDHMV
jgi:hypothetical protein